jgi:hypothetical protein
VQTSDLTVQIDKLLGPKLGRLGGAAIPMVVLGAVLLGVGFVLGGDHKLQVALGGWLVGYLFWFMVTAGSLGLLMIHHVVGGGWGFILRRFLEAGTRMLPLMAILFLPILYGAITGQLYEWGNRELVARDHILSMKAGYLNWPRFLICAVIYFGLWVLWANKLNSLGAQQDERNDPDTRARLSYWAGFGLVMMVITLTFVAVDWVMSLRPHWYSTMFGPLLMVACGLTTLGFTIFMVGWLAGDTEIIRRVPHGYFRDLGNLTLAFTLLWAYMTFSQYLIIYSGNLLEEVPYYVARREGYWGVLSLSMIVLHFLAPFMILLVNSGLKRSPQRLWKFAAFLLFMRFVDIVWWIGPEIHAPVAIWLAALGGLLFIGGWWLMAWVPRLRGRTLAPLHAPGIEEHLAHAHHAEVAHG